MLEIVSSHEWLQRNWGQIFCLGMTCPAVGLQTRGEDDGLGSVPRKNRWTSGQVWAEREACQWCPMEGDLGSMSRGGGSWEPGLLSCPHGTRELHPIVIRMPGMGESKNKGRGVWVALASTTKWIKKQNKVSELFHFQNSRLETVDL